MEIDITQKQRDFINSASDEVLFGGAAGGGKSYGQLIDAFLFALKYPKSKQLILRRTYPELERSLILVHLALYPKEIYSYNSGNHRGIFKNGSIIEFGYCDNEKDVYKYQSAEYDVIRFDELTHFTESMYLYLISRVRGANRYPKQVKSSTNPGGVGHQWVKARFIDTGEWGREIKSGTGTRIFIPAKAEDNRFLMDSDPGYVKRLDNLSEADRKALKYGEWDIFEGQYFSMWDREIHVIEPFQVPDNWQRYMAMDYGLDMLAAYDIAVDTHERAYVIREVYEPDLIISEAAKRVKPLLKPNSICLAPPDLWNRRQDTGRSVADVFAEKDIYLSKADNRRVQGWYDVAEWLKPTVNEFGERDSNLKIFSCCLNLIRCLPSVVRSQRDPNDISYEPHELTHSVDALRYFCAGRPRSAPAPKPYDQDYISEDEQINDFLNFGR